MATRALGFAFLLSALALGGCTSPAPAGRAGLSRIDHIVVIYAENRSFDNLYGLFPGASGIADATPEQYTQVDVDGKPLPHLPPVWKGSAPDPAFPRDLPNRPFRIDAPPINLPLSERTRDLNHKFYPQQEQINGGRNDRFVAVSDAGALTMGYYDGSKLPMWQWAREYTLADHFFTGAFGDSFLNHFWLVCACTPTFPGAPADMHTVVDPATGLPTAGHDKQLTPAGEDYVINTAFSVNSPHPATVPAAQLVPEQTAPTIGDRLSGAGVSWAWYAGGWDDAVAGHPPRCSSSTTSRSPTSPTTPTAPRAAPPTSRTRPTSSPPPRRAPCRPCPSSSRSARTTSTLATPTWRAASGTSSA